jgi:hypothetical protein
VNQIERQNIRIFPPNFENISTSKNLRISGGTREWIAYLPKLVKTSSNFAPPSEISDNFAAIIQSDQTKEEHFQN